MKTFKQFMTEVYDPDVQGRSQISRKTGEGGRVGADRRKSEPEKRRMKLILLAVAKWCQQNHIKIEKI